MATDNTANALQEQVAIQHWAEQLFAAKHEQQPYPRVTDKHPELNLATAYAIQHEFNRLCLDQGAEISGYKAALTAAPAQAAMGIDQPIVGVLFAEGNWAHDQGNAAVSLAQIPKLILETELGFTLSQKVDAPLDNLQQLKDITASCSPMIEFACTGFGDLAPTGVDLIASNSASRCYVQGAAFDWAAADLDALDVSLVRDGETLHSSSSGSLLEGQWQALLWLINTSIANGYQVLPGQILMTGSIGGLHPAQPGSHSASYSAAGELSLVVS